MNLKVKVKYFGSVKDEAGTELEILELEDGLTVSGIVDIVKNRHKSLGSRKGQILFALNQSYTIGDSEVHDGDELALFPMVSGG